MIAPIVTVRSNNATDEWARKFSETEVGEVSDARCYRLCQFTTIAAVWGLSIVTRGLAVRYAGTRFPQKDSRSSAGWKSAIRI